MDNRLKIKTLLKERKMNVRALARRCGVAHSTIYRYLNGDTSTIKEDLLAKIAEVLGVPTSVFYEPDVEAMDVQIKADYLRAELIQMRITDEEFDRLEDYLQYLKSKRR